MNEEEFKKRWEKAQRLSKIVYIYNKTKSLLFIADDYRMRNRTDIYKDVIGQIVFLFIEGEYIGYIKLNSIYEIH